MDGSLMDFDIHFHLSGIGPGIGPGLGYGASLRGVLEGVKSGGLVSRVLGSLGEAGFWIGFPVLGDPRHIGCESVVDGSLKWDMTSNLKLGHGVEKRDVVGIVLFVGFLHLLREASIGELVENLVANGVVAFHSRDLGLDPHDLSTEDLDILEESRVGCDLRGHHVVGDALDLATVLEHVQVVFSSLVLTIIAPRSWSGKSRSLPLLKDRSLGIRTLGVLTALVSHEASNLLGEARNHDDPFFVQKTELSHVGWWLVTVGDLHVTRLGIRVVLPLLCSSPTSSAELDEEYVFEYGLQFVGSSVDLVNAAIEIFLSDSLRRRG